ncbi:MAG: leucine-rich repeat protein [Clostridia bacterium]|nr:leucine-rich repeat protein [Clostridia bacterium]
MTPYEGSKPYIFISYAHKDAERVLPIIEALAESGFRVWYDAGIEAGTEWPEYIAAHLRACHVMLAFISPAFDASHNCRREINYAINKKVNVIAVYWESFELSGGLELQLGTLHSIYRERHKTNESFLTELSRSELMLPCMAIDGNAPKDPAASTVSLEYNTNQAGDGDLLIQDGVLLEYRGKEREVILPREVRAIGEAAFIRSDIEKIVIPHGVSAIGQAAFQSCAHLTSVTIPGSVKTVGDAAFLGCETLTEVILETGLETIGNNMFAMCTALKSVTIPASVKEIGQMAFVYCVSLEDLTLSSGLERIGSDSFGECRSLTAVAIPETVKEIGVRAFVNCRKLAKAYLGKRTKYARFFNRSFPKTTWVIKN